MTDVPGAAGHPTDPKAVPPKTDAAMAAHSGDKSMEEWKPEPRQWTWKDLFTAPMLAFKPKCMIISALTLVAITLWMWICDEKIVPASYGPITQNILYWVQFTVAIILFSLGASLVAVFLKADLLDDEFLSLGEAVGQYKTRILPAVLVPLFLMSLVAGVYLALVYLPVLASSIPFVGPFFYAILYPLLFLFSLFVLVLTIAVWLSIFVFPAIIAIRKHGWFDNVVDTIEAVGTKPHVLFGSLVLSGIMMYVCLSIGMGSIGQLKNQYEVLPTSFQDSVRDTEARASQFYAGNMTHLVDKHVIHHLNKVPFVYFPSASVDTGQLANSGNNGFLQLFTGPVTGLWQILIQGLILGYVLNLFISGGMLTYLIVREDDYWDDENLEDLDKLAKELEEEAKRDQGVSSSTAAKPAEAAKPPEPPKPPEPAAPAKPPEATAESPDKSAEPPKSDPAKTDEPPKA
jgi:hypothetical protein